MTIKEVRKMAGFFLKEFFDNIPMLRIEYDAICDEMNQGICGCFGLHENEEYDLDKEDPEMAELLRNSSEYKVRYREYGGIGYTSSYDPEYTDVLHKPEPYIILNETIKRNKKMITSVLLHELVHYWCWYLGYDHHDGDKQFENKIKELGLRSNFSNATFRDGEWQDDFDYDTVQKYIDLYERACK